MLRIRATRQAHVSQFFNSFLPSIVFLIAIPNPLQNMTLREPIIEQTLNQITNLRVEVPKKIEIGQARPFFHDHK